MAIEELERASEQRERGRAGVTHREDTGTRQLKVGFGSKTLVEKMAMAARGNERRKGKVESQILAERT